MTLQCFEKIASIVCAAHARLLDLWNCNLTARKMKSLAIHFAKHETWLWGFCIGYNRRMDPDCVRHVVDIVRYTHVDYLSISYCDLLSESLEAMAAQFSQSNAKIMLLFLAGNKNIQPAGFFHLVNLLEYARVRFLFLDDCNLTTIELRAMANGIAGKNVKLITFGIRGNKRIDVEGFKFVTLILRGAKVEELYMEDCDLTAKKLHATESHLYGQNIELKLIQIDNNKTIEPEGFEHLVNILANCKAEQLSVKDCNLTAQKLKMMDMHIVCRKVKLKVFTIDENRRMQPECFVLIVDIVSHGSVDELAMRNCDLTAEKLKIIANCFKDRNSTVETWAIDKNRTIEPEGFRLVVDILEYAKVRYLSMQECCLMNDKLKVMAEVLLGRNIQLQELDLDGNRRISPQGFLFLLDIVHHGNVERLSLSHCNITSQKLKPIADHLARKNTTIKCLYLDNNRTLEPDGFKHLADILQHGSVEELHLCECSLSDAKLRPIAEHVRANPLKLSHLDVSRNRSISFDFINVLLDIMAAITEPKLGMRDCDLDLDHIKCICAGLEERDISLDFLDLSQRLYDVSPQHMRCIHRLCKRTKNNLLLNGWILNVDQLTELIDFLQNGSFGCLEVIVEDFEKGEIRIPERKQESRASLLSRGKSRISKFFRGVFSSRRDGRNVYNLNRAHNS